MAEVQANSTDMSQLYRQFLPLFGGLFFCHLGVGMSLSTLPFFVGGRLMGDEVAVGVAVAAISLAVVLSRPVAGRLADRHGFKPMMMLGAVLCALAGGLYFAASTLAVLVAVRILHGIGEAAVFTGGATWLVQLAPAERRGKVVGLFGISMWTGITLGAFLGTQIMEAGGFGAVWAACLVSPVIGLLLIRSKESPEQAPPAKRQALLPSTALLPGLALSMGASGYAAIATFAALYLASRGIAYPVMVLAAYGTAYVGIRLVAGHWPDRYGPRRVAFWSALVEAGGLVLVAVAPDLPLGPAGGAGNLCAAALGGLVVGSGLSLLYPSLALIVINRTDKAQQGAALGTYTSFWDLGILVWGPATGFVARMAGYPALYMVTTASAVVSAILVLTLAAVPAEADARSGMSARRTGGAG